VYFRQCVNQTGGDENGHPGIAIYHNGYYLLSTVSTGDRFWTVLVAGALKNNTWTNIGLRWLPETTEEDKRGLTVRFLFQIV